MAVENTDVSEMSEVPEDADEVDTVEEAGTSDAVEDTASADELLLVSEEGGAGSGWLASVVEADFEVGDADVETEAPDVELASESAAVPVVDMA